MSFSLSQFSPHHLSLPILSLPFLLTDTPPPQTNVTTTATIVTVLVHRTHPCHRRLPSLPSLSTIDVPSAPPTPALFYSRRRRRQTFVLTVLISLVHSPSNSFSSPVSIIFDRWQWRRRKCRSWPPTMVVADEGKDENDGGSSGRWWRRMMAVVVGVSEKKKNEREMGWECERKRTCEISILPLPFLQNYKTRHVYKSGTRKRVSFFFHKIILNKAIKRS